MIRVKGLGLRVKAPDLLKPLEPFALAIGGIMLLHVSYVVVGNLLIAGGEQPLTGP